MKFISLEKLKRFYEKIKNNIEDGTLKAKSAENADTATTATKATQDESGNNIVNTYATKTALSSGLAGKSDTDHTHDYAASSHTHDDRYYTESEIDTKLADYMPKSGGTFTGIVTGTEFHAGWFYPKNNIDSGYGFEENANGETYLRLVSNNAMTIDSPKGIDINGKANHSGIILTRKGTADGATVSIGQENGNVTIGDPTNENNGYTVINNDCKMLESLTVAGDMSVEGTVKLNGNSILSGTYDASTATLTINL